MAVHRGVREGGAFSLEMGPLTDELVVQLQLLGRISRSLRASLLIGCTNLCTALPAVKGASRLPPLVAKALHQRIELFPVDGVPRVADEPCVHVLVHELYRKDVQRLVVSSLWMR